MERLTKHSKQTSHENGICCTHFRGPECLRVGGNCAMNCKWEEAAWSRLAAYEDTERTPEEIDMDHEAAEQLRHLCRNCDIDRLEELAEADKACRLVVLPCKVGDTVWVTGRDNVPREMELEAPDIRAVCTDEDNLCMSTCNRKPDGFCAYRLRNDGADVGKTVFLTHEEAEAALEAMKDG
jgi:hypothetical protein